MNKQFPDDQNSDPRATLEEIREKVEAATQDYAAGKLNAVQFNAIYRHYSEKRMIIEKLIERDPTSDAWRAAAKPGATGFLRDRYESRVIYYLVFRNGEKKPLVNDGKLPKKAAKQIHKLLQVIWAMKSNKQGLARKSLGDGLWLLLNMGEFSMTLVVYFLQPSDIQVNQLRDLHQDFERANKLLLQRNATADRMVFPQRSLLNKS